MLSRWLGLAALAAVLPVLAGCGSVVSASETTGNQLSIYSSLPLQGPDAATSEQIEGGEKLALSDTGGQIGPFRISYDALDDANPTSGQATPGEVSTAAKQAAQDTTTIAYLGDYGSAATAVSLPIINEAGILQVSTASPYVGLTSSLDAGQDEPERFYPSGKRTFGRLQPGDPVQAAAQASLMRSLGVHTVYLLDDQDPFQMPLAAIVAQDAEGEGIKVAAHDSIPVTEGSSFSGEVEKIVASHAQAVFLAGGAGPGAVSLWRALHSADPHLLLLGSSGLASEAFTSGLGSAAGVTYLTTPLLGEALYPPAGRHVLARYRTVFHREGGPSVLYGYEAMSVVLDAIRRAGDRGNNRPDVIKAFMATHDRNSVIGRYSIQPNGETTLSTYGVDRVRGGQPVFFKAIHTTPGPAAAGV
ncbi:MAG: branched-chain amino acid ABC transporter substrate-binding protein [Solirubrobacteraceae bacterium]